MLAEGILATVAFLLAAALVSRVGVTLGGFVASKTHRPGSFVEADADERRSADPHGGAKL